MWVHWSCSAAQGWAGNCMHGGCFVHGVMQGAGVADWLLRGRLGVAHTHRVAAAVLDAWVQHVAQACSLHRLQCASTLSAGSSWLGLENEVPLQGAASPDDSSGLGKLKVRPISGPAGALVTWNAGAGEDQHAQPLVLHRLQPVESTSLAVQESNAWCQQSDLLLTRPQHGSSNTIVDLNTAAPTWLRAPPAAPGAAPARRCSLPPMGHAMKGCWQAVSPRWASSHSRQAGRQWCARRNPACGLVNPWAACQGCPAGSSG